MNYSRRAMCASATETEAKRLLTQEEIIGLAARAKSDLAAIDEMMSAFVLHAETARKSERRVESLSRQVTQLEHRLAVLLQRMFGRSSEKIDPAQLQLFLDTVPTADPEAEEPQTEVVSFKRRVKGHGRDSFPAHLKRVDIRLEPDAAALHCGVCGKDYCRIREEISEKGHIVPGYWEIRRYIRGVWACRNGCGTVVTADLPPAVVEKSRFEPSVPVHTAVAKFGDHIPLERQSEMHARLGVEIAPTTLGDGLADLAALHAPTVSQMESEVVAEKHLHVDDTPVVAIVAAPKPILGSGDCSATTASPQTQGKKKLRKLARVWVYVTLTGKVSYRFTEDRSRDGNGGPGQVLKDFEGCLICDEYAGFDRICGRPGMSRAACWAHSRRKFKDALSEDKRRSGRILAMIGRLFWIEAAVRKRKGSRPTFDADQHLRVRQRRSKRVVERIIAYARSIQGDVIPDGALGRALGYLTGNIEHLQTFLADPLIPIDNNAAERALRAVAVGRKNYLHFGSLAGGDTAAVFYSLIGSCKALGINPYAYLSDTTKTLLANRDTPRAQLTPWAWAAAQAARLTANSNPTTPAADSL